MRTSALCFLLSLTVTGSNPADLVKKLGASRYAHREAASASLERLGREALPALKAARDSPDAEIRNRAVELVDRIETDLMIRPTMINLDFRDVPIDRVAQAIGARGGVRLPLSGSTPGLKARRLTLTHPMPVPLWQAIDELSRAGDLEVNGNGVEQGTGSGSDHAPSISLFAVPAGGRPTPTSISGPFRTSLQSLTHDRDRSFEPGNGGIIAPLAINPAPRERFPSREQFALHLQILAEPRMTASLDGLVRLVEAVDERGRSLLTTNPREMAFQHQSGYNRIESPGGSSIQVTLPLTYPDEPGRYLKKIRGQFSATVSARKEDPIVIPLDESQGHAFRTNDSVLTIQEIRIDPATQTLIVDLAIRSMGRAETNGFGGDQFLVRTPGTPQNQLEFVDEEGRVLTRWHVVTERPGPEGSLLSLRVMLAGGTPVLLRYFDVTRAVTEASFEFHDIEMP